MNATAPVRSTAVGLRWPSAKIATAIQAVRRECLEEGKEERRDSRKMPNGDPPPATLWGTDAGE